MKNIRQLHREAMEFVKKANDALSQGDRQAHKNFTEKAFFLEKESAYELIDKLDSEPTRGVLFRSAAYLAYNLEFIDEAKELIELGLSGNPFPEIKSELNELLQKINTKISERKLLNQKNVNKENKDFRKDRHKSFDQAKLITGLNEKSPEAIRSLFDNYYSELVALAYRMIDNQGEAEDIGIAAITRLVSRSIKFSSIEQLKAYLYISTRNGCLNFLRTKNRKIDLDSNLFNRSFSEDNWNIEKLKNEIINFTDKLPPQTGEVIRLTMENFTPDEIAKKMDITINQVYTLKSKGIQTLREKMLKLE